MEHAEAAIRKYNVEKEKAAQDTKKVTARIKELEGWIFPLWFIWSQLCPPWFDGNCLLTMTPVRFDDFHLLDF